jgi:hypothetical protein
MYATVPQPSVGGGEAGLRRLVGQGKAHAVLNRNRKVPNRPAEANTLRKDADELRDHAVEQGRRLAQELHKIRGGAYMANFMSGMGKLEITHGDEMESESEEEMVGNGKLTVMHGGVGVLPDIQPGYGNPAQAPQSFIRNQVGLGKSQKKHLGLARKVADDKMEAKEMKKEAELEGMGRRKTMENVRAVAQAVDGAGKVDKRKARGAAIGKLMREKGMSLAEASRHIKEHGM